MPQGYGQPNQETRPSPSRLRQDLGYVPAKAPTAGGGGSSGGGITVLGGLQPQITLTPIPSGEFLGNFTGADASPVPYVFAFTRLNDVPASYVGQALKGVRVNAAETALEFGPAAGGGGGAFVPLSAGTEPLTFISDGAGQAIEVPYTP